MFLKLPFDLLLPIGGKNGFNCFFLSSDRVEMDLTKRFGLLVFLFIFIAAISQYPTSVEPRAAVTVLLHPQQPQSKHSLTLQLALDILFYFLREKVKLKLKFIITNI